MDAEGKIEQYCILAKGARGLALQDLIQRATAEPGIFAFGELLSVPAVQEVLCSAVAPVISCRLTKTAGRSIRFSVRLINSICGASQLSGPARDLLELFSYGTLADYRGGPPH